METNYNIVAESKRLTGRQKEIAKILIGCALELTDISFSELHPLVGTCRKTIGGELEAIGQKCLMLGLPIITVLVVYKGSRKTGSGFYSLLEQRAGNTVYDRKIATQKEIEAVYACKDWSALLDGDAIIRNPYLDEIPYGSSKEGGQKKVIVNSYERDRSLREKCLKIHGYSCYICDFNAAEKYGEQFKSLIHVHHKTPLAQIGKEHKVDPEKDLVPVCPNCHMILHSKGKGDVYDVDEIKKLYNSINS